MDVSRWFPQSVFQAHQELKRDVIKMLAIQRAVLQAEAEVAALTDQRQKLAELPLPTAKPFPSQPAQARTLSCGAGACMAACGCVCAPLCVSMCTFV